MPHDAPRPDRSIELETKLAFLERTVEELHEVTLAQGAALERLAARIAALEAGAPGAERTDGGPLDPMSERPPHY